MKSKNLIILYTLLLLGCTSNNLQKPDIVSSTNPTIYPSLISSPQPSNEPVMIKKSYEINSNINQLLKDNIGEKTISGIYTDDNGNSIFSTLDSFYYLSGFNKFTFTEAPSNSSSGSNFNKFYLNKNGDGFYIFTLPMNPVGAISGTLYDIKKPRIIKFKHFIPENQNYEINYDYISNYSFFTDLNKAFYYDFSEANKLKIFSIDNSNLVESKLEKEITFPDTNTKGNETILNKNGDGIILKKKNNSDDYNIYKLNDKNLSFLGSQKSPYNFTSYFKGNIDLEGNGYIYCPSESNKEIYIFQVSNYSITFNEYKLIDISIDNLWYSDLYLNNNGKGFLINHSNKNELFFSEIEDFKISSKPLLINGQYSEYNTQSTRDFIVSINKYGDGFISWSSTKDIYTPIGTLKILKDYRLL